MREVAYYLIGLIALFIVVIVLAVAYKRCLMNKYKKLDIALKRNAQSFAKRLALRVISHKKNK